MPTLVWTNQSGRENDWLGKIYLHIFAVTFTITVLFLELQWTGAANTASNAL